MEVFVLSNLVEEGDGEFAGYSAGVKMSVVREKKADDVVYWTLVQETMVKEPLQDAINRMVRFVLTDEELTALVKFSQQQQESDNAVRPSL